MAVSEEEVHMSEQSNLDIVKKGYECFGNGDIPGLLELFADDIEWTLPEVQGAPHGGARRGKEAVTEFFTLLNEAEEITHFEPSEFIAEGDRIVVLGSVKATARSTGRSYETDWVHVFRVTDGKVASFREHFNTAAVNRAFEKAATA
jgi:ketosteroid isomerase-like protein